MKKFLDENFLLNSKTAEVLYHNYAKKMPIFDYHCHLSPKEIYENKKFRNITEAWLGGDHYKWRAMRTYGIEEDYITGNKSDYEKFLEWSKMMPYAIGNPLYHWTHLELQRYFDIDEVLDESSADRIWTKANKVLETLTAQEMIEKSNVQYVCTTDDPVDSLEWHIKLKKANLPFKVLPAFRPDKAINIELSWFEGWVKQLEKVVNTKFDHFQKFLDALTSRVEFFHEVGCRLSDHALDIVMYEQATFEEAAQIFEKGLKKESLTQLEIRKYKGFMMVFFGRLYNKHKWVQQYHIGALRNNSKRNLQILGPDTGYDAINDATYIADLSKLLDALDETDELPKTILYCLNPRDNEIIGTIIGCFQGGKIRNKMQFGSGWWFNDQLDGMKKQIEALSQLGLVSGFVGMLTDSRSFLSYTRHEYFRRLLSDYFGNLIESGQYPNDIKRVGQIIEDICYNNAYHYFKM